MEAQEPSWVQSARPWPCLFAIVSFQRGNKLGCLAKLAPVVMTCTLHFLTLLLMSLWMTPLACRPLNHSAHAAKQMSVQCCR